VLALDLHGRARLTEEALHGLRVLEGLGEHELERDGLVEVHVLGRHDDAHPAGAEGALDAVFAREDVAGLDRAERS
jgi:hypothetical protein